MLRQKTVTAGQFQDKQVVKIVFIKEFCYSAPKETRADMTNTLGIRPILTCTGRLP